MKKLFEEYIESADYKISVFFKELKSQIEKWFDTGSLAAQGCELDGDIQIIIYNPMEKFLMFNFTEPLTEEDLQIEEENSLYRYRVIFMVRLDQMSGEEDDVMGQEENMPQEESKSLEINKVLLKIHQFNEEGDEKGELVEEINVEDIKEDFLIDKLGQLKDKSEDTDTEDNTDLKDNIYVK